MSLRLKDLLSFPQECAQLFVSIWKHLPDRWVIFPSSNGLTGQKGIHRDLVSNGDVDIQLLLALKSNYQVICIWPLMKERAMQNTTQTVCDKKKRSYGNNIVKLKISTLITVLQQVILIPPDNSGLSNSCIILPQTPSSLPDLIPCAENCLNVGYTQMTDILSWGKY